MHRFFFEKEDRNPFISASSPFEEPSLEMIIEELIKSSLPLKRRARGSSLNVTDRELNNPYNIVSQSKNKKTVIKCFFSNPQNPQ